MSIYCYVLDKYITISFIFFVKYQSVVTCSVEMTSCYLRNAQIQSTALFQLADIIIYCTTTYNSLDEEITMLAYK